MNGDITAAGFRSFMEWTGSTGRKSDTNLGIILRSASDFLERRTGRLITASASNTVRTFTTNGRAYVNIPDLRTAATVSLQGAALTADSSYWLIPSRQSPDISIGVQLRAFGTTSYLANPDWFDRNLDQQWARTGGYEGSLPNDLSVTGLWGWTSTPDQWVMAIYAMAGYVYQHSDALFSGARATPEGFLLNLNAMPSEVQALVEDWTIGDQAALA